MKNKLRTYSKAEEEILKQFNEVRQKFMDEHEIGTLSDLGEYMLRGENEENEVLAIGRSIPGYTEIVERDLEAFQKMNQQRDKEANLVDQIRRTSEIIN
jgi:hypothetical protein